MKQTTVVVETPSRTPIVRKANEGELIALPLGDQYVSVSRDETMGSLEIIAGTVLPTMGVPIHSHRAFDEAFYVVEGTLTLLIGDVKHEVGAGSSALIPAGVVHSYKNTSSKPAKFLQITAPGGMEGFLRDLAARPFLNFEELAAIAEEHGTDILAPPF